MKRRTLFSIIVVTLTAGCFTLFYGMHSMWTDTQSSLVKKDRSGRDQVTRSAAKAHGT